MTGFQAMFLVRKWLIMARYFVSSRDVHASTEIQTSNLLLAVLSFALSQTRLPPSPTQFSFTQLLRVENFFRRISPKASR